MGRRDSDPLAWREGTPRLRPEGLDSRKDCRKSSPHRAEAEHPRRGSTRSRYAVEGTTEMAAKPPGSASDPVPPIKQRCREHEKHDKFRRARRFKSTIERDLTPKTHGGGATETREAVVSQGRSSGVVSTKNTTSPADHDDSNRQSSRTERRRRMVAEPPKPAKQSSAKDEAAVP